MSSPLTGPFLHAYVMDVRKKEMLGSTFCTEQGENTEKAFYQ